VSVALGKDLFALGKGFAECHTRQRTHGKFYVGKGYLTSLTTVPSLDTSGRRDLSNLPSFSSLRRVSCAGGSSYAGCREAHKKHAVLSGLPHLPASSLAAATDMRRAYDRRATSKPTWGRSLSCPPPT
jgi:hypothetical protein